LTLRRRDQAALDEAQEQLQKSERLRKELERRQTIVDNSMLSVVSSLYGSSPLSQSAPEVFKTWMQRYGATLDLALENLAFKVDKPVSQRLYALAEEMGDLHAGPRDVAELHSQTLAQKTLRIPALKAEAMIEEGRFIVLELMGDLVSFYRKN
jgi:hypothetical protein